MAQDLADGESFEMRGSAAKPYVLTNTGGLYSCTCPAWQFQSAGIDQRTCKHLKKLRGEQAELDRIGNPVSRAPVSKSGSDDKDKPALLLANRWEEHHDLIGWWMSEKLDGVRAYWDGEQFISRLGNRYVAPDWFTEHLPDQPLDGELWAGRGQFQETVSIVRRARAHDGWKAITYLVFDAPDHDGAFEDRQEWIAQLFEEIETSHVEVVQQALCRGIEHLREELARIEDLGGEGLMLRQPRSRYERGRSSTLLKVKSFFDAEAKVTGHIAGKGRHKGRLGSLKVVRPDGIEFQVGTGFSDKEREDPPQVGAVITYRYQELSKAGVPRFPSYVGVRADPEWPGDEAAVQIIQRPDGQTWTLAVQDDRVLLTLPSADAARDAADLIAATFGAKKKKAAKKKKKATTKVAASAQALDGARTFELVDGKSSKFWEIAVDGDSHSVRYGRIGTKGQTRTKTFASEAAAEKDADKLIQKKLDKGYAETS